MACSGSVGIIANPYAGKDVRRLLTWAPAAPMAALGQLLRRTLRGIAAAKAGKALVMPDPYRLGEQAMDGMGDLDLPVELLPMTVTGTPLDTLAAVQAMAEAGAGVLLVVGGDGTNRVVARAESLVPILPIAYGTNNVFPWKIEAAAAGYAGGLYANTPDPACSHRAKRWRLYHKGSPTDMALVDVALSRQQWSGSRAVWEPDLLQEIYVSFCGPAEVGLASIAGALLAADRHAPYGVRVRLAPPGEASLCQVTAHLLPGHFVTVPVLAYELIPQGARCPLIGTGMLALDGERTVWCDGQDWEIELAGDGPVVLDPNAILSRRTHRYTASEERG